tara:strand:- start:104 stop:481 length:378 start_codon:yes stop_codon:yes gene_type:complete
MKNTEEVLRDNIRHRIDRIVQKVKKDTAQELLDEVLQSLVKVKYAVPPELRHNPKETEAQAKARRKKLEEWNSYLYGAEFSYYYDHPLVIDIVQIINDEVDNYVHNLQEWEEWRKANSPKKIKIR